MAAGSALSLFTDFFTHTTGPAILSSPDAIINDAQLRNYEMYDVLSRSKREVQGGAQIKDQILLDDPGTAEWYLPGASTTVTNTQHLSTMSVNWRFIRVPITWNEKEILLNEGGGSSKVRYHQFKKLKESKYQAAYTSLMKTLEVALIATANNATMEAATGDRPYSIFATVTSDGLAPSGFTTVQNINPTTKTNWRNQNTTYTASTPYDVDNGIVAGFDTMSQLVHFKVPSGHKQYFESSDWKSLVIVTNKEGRRDYMKALRANNDITRVGPQDPSYGDPVFNSIPVRFVEGFDDQSTFSAGSPDFLFLNMNYIKVIFRRGKWMQVGSPITYPDKPDTTVIWCDTYLNVFNCSRRRHGYLQAS